MSADDSLALPPPADALAGAPPDDAAPTGTWGWLESKLEIASEWLNPILVKEARQALKSLQFAISFAAVLLFAYGWSLVGLATTEASPNAAERQGPQMLMGYCVILAFPLIVIIPFTAFRSLAVEREDGTYDLLCVTTLGTDQIILGKLTSAMVQMAVYLSAVAPCIAFTYLLPGANIVGIGFILTYLVATSVFLSTLSLLLATGTKAKHWQVILSIAVVLALFGAFIGAFNIINDMTRRDIIMPIELPQFWVSHLAVLVTLATFATLFIFAASAQISFAADNHSTRIRGVMAVQTALFIGFMAYYFAEMIPAEGIIVISSGVAIVWAVLGSLMMGESGDLSPRARRELPQSFLGRVLFTWFNPGSGTGYVFVLANMGLLALIIGFDACVNGLIVGYNDVIDYYGVSWLGASRIDWRMPEWEFMSFRGNPPDARLYVFYLLCYLAFYLGIGRLLLLFLGWLFRGTDATGALADARGGPVLSLVLHILILLVGVFTPLTIQLTFTRDNSFTVMQTFNPFWTLSIVANSYYYNSQAAPSEVTTLLTCLAGATVLVNLLLTLGDVSVAREEAPERVREEDAAQAPPPPVAKDPFADREFKTPKLGEE